MVGKEGAEAIQEMLNHARKPGAGIFATIIGFATLLFAASGVFGQLQDAMNTIWEVQPRSGRGLLGMLKDRFFSFTMVLGSGFLLLTSLILSTTVAATFRFLGGLAPVVKPLLQVGGHPRLRRRRDAALRPDLQGTARRQDRLARRMGRRGADNGHVPGGQGVDRRSTWAWSSYGSAYGAAGSLVVLLVWIYYSSQILFFGAEFTKVYAEHYGNRIEAFRGCRAGDTSQMRAQQGIPRSDTHS